MYSILEDDIVWFRRRDSGWTNFGQFKDPNIEEDKITSFLAVTPICDTEQAMGIQVQRLEASSSDWEVYDADVNNK